ncbi:MAG: phosphatidate cytidylyltransferase [Candidatus Dependentiae bacterium]
MTGTMKTFIKRAITGFFLGLLFWLSFVYFPPFYFSFILAGILATIIIFEWKNFFSVRRLAFWLTMPLYPILPFVILIVMNQNSIYHSLLFILFIIVSSFDTGSYIVGTFIGKHKLAPTISPSKTWEGVIGGYIFACIGLFLVLWELKKMQPLSVILIFTLCVCILSLIGDLFESWLKRLAQIKDSGNLLPGHGGFLDRFDGILFAVIFFYIFRDFLVELFKF